jgi:hypothetical protein
MTNPRCGPRKTFLQSFNFLKNSPILINLTKTLNLFKNLVLNESVLDKHGLLTSFGLADAGLVDQYTEKSKIQFISKKTLLMLLFRCKIIRENILRDSDKSLLQNNLSNLFTRFAVIFVWSTQATAHLMTKISRHIINVIRTLKYPTISNANTSKFTTKLCMIL